MATCLPNMLRRHVLRRYPMSLGTEWPFICSHSLSTRNYGSRPGGSHRADERVGKKHDGRKSLSTYEREVEGRREAAHRTVVVQGVDEDQVRRHLQQYGIIESAVQFHHARKSFFMVEYKERTSVADLMVDTGYSFGEFPVRSRVMFLNQHSIKKKRAPQKDITSHEHVLSSLKKCVSISDQMDALHQCKRLTQQEKHLRFFIASAIEEALSGILPHCQIKPFGSCINGFGWTDCDLDFTCNIFPPDTQLGRTDMKFISAKQQYARLSEDQRSRRVLEGLSQTLRSYVPLCSEFQNILKARVPIVRFRHGLAGVRCDLSYHDNITHKLSELMFVYGCYNPDVYPLMSVVKQWARDKLITRPMPGRYATNFILLAMVVFYMQTQELLPTVGAMQVMADSNSEFLNGGESFYFVRDMDSLPKPTDTRTLEELLHGFFSFYTKFNFRRRRISLVTGTSFDKTSDSAMQIENPLDITLNVSRSMAPTEVINLQSEMLNALRTMDTHSRSSSSEDWGIMCLFSKEDLAQSATVHTSSILDSRQKQTHDILKTDGDFQTSASFLR
ncbi:poly(A) RNA polymerase, mitochondrial-like [Haliotis cracherodii]|uniref:poly(A) RNA polymerase, mitochondrial-like n=1 Tax=Haliotis cracherodii TaxID=6455 RepID=UPI0039EAD69F